MMAYGKKLCIVVVLVIIFGIFYFFINLNKNDSINDSNMDINSESNGKIIQNSETGIYEVYDEKNDTKITTFEDKEMMEVYKRDPYFDP